MPEATELKETVVREMTAEDAIGVAELVQRTYGGDYIHERIYHPDQFFQDQAAGLQTSEVAVDGSGEVVGHWAFVFHGPKVAESCMTITDERYRGHGIASQMEKRLLARLEERGVKWMMGEPLLAHTASQEVVVAHWNQGAITGIRLKSVVHLDVGGFEEHSEHGRLSLAVAFGPLAEMTPHDVWLPADYAGILGLVLEPTKWMRTIRTEAPEVLSLPDASRLTTDYNEDMKSAVIEVEAIGADFADEVGRARDELRRRGALYIELRVPTNSPASTNAGLLDEGFSFAGFLPEMKDGSDLLLLQWLEDPEVDRDAWELLNEHLERLADEIIAQADLAARLRRH